MSKMMSSRDKRCTQTEEGTDNCSDGRSHKMVKISHNSHEKSAKQWIKTKRTLSGVPFMASQMQLGVPPTLLYSGSKFVGYKVFDGKCYELEVVFKYVNEINSYLCGYLKVIGLSEEYPSITTFFEGEIISEKYPFLTRSYDKNGTNEVVDRSEAHELSPHFHEIWSTLRKYWSKFWSFYPFEYVFNCDDFDYNDLKNTDFVFMRWKERFFVADHTIKDISFDGFYYICFTKSMAAIEGYYYQRKSKTRTVITLVHKPEHSLQIYEFR